MRNPMNFFLVYFFVWFCWKIRYTNMKCFEVPVAREWHLINVSNWIRANFDQLYSLCTPGDFMVLLNLCCYSLFFFFKSIGLSIFCTRWRLKLACISMNDILTIKKSDRMNNSVILNCDNIAVLQTFIPFTFFRRDNHFTPCYLGI